MTPRPPAFVTIATPSPRGRGMLANPCNRSKNSSSVLTLITPASAMAALYTISLPDNAPVWEEAALAPVDVRPAFKAMMGLHLDVAAACSMNCLPRRIPSTYMPITRVSGSSRKYASRSASSMSSLFPTETNWEKPILVPLAQSSRIVPIAPDCDVTATWPGIGKSSVNVAFRRLRVLITPRQLGPSTLMPYLEAISPTRRSSSAPSGPVSRNPADMMTATFTPFLPACSITPGTTVLGTATTAMSTGPGMERTSGYALRSNIRSAFGLTGYITPE